jgi:hypothetical protein
MRRPKLGAADGKGRIGNDAALSHELCSGDGCSQANSEGRLSPVGKETDRSGLPGRGKRDEAARSRPLGNHKIPRQRETAAGLLNPTIAAANRRHH